MKINYYFRIVILFLVFIVAVSDVISQNLKPGEKVIEEKGILHFNEKEFTKALFYLNRLMETYPKDPFFNYYAGVSRTELERDLDDAIYQLKIASLKNVPDNVFFYLGKANHISENYNDALKYYERYLSIGDKNEIEKFQVQRLLRMCQSKVNPETSGTGVEKVNGRSGEIPVSDNEADDTGEEEKGSTGQQEITDYDELVKEALKWQIKADSVRRQSNQKRQYLPQLSSRADRDKVEKEILLCEDEAYDYQTKADALYLRVKDLEQEMKGEPENSLSSFDQDLVNIENQQFIEHLEEVKPFNEQKTSEDKEIQVKLVYKIQVAAFRKQVQPDFLKGLTSVTSEKIDNTSITRYFTGLFKTYATAYSELSKVRKQGFPDAYIVSYFDGRKISLNRAMILEND